MGRAVIKVKVGDCRVFSCQGRLCFSNVSGVEKMMCCASEVCQTTLLKLQLHAALQPVMC